MPSNRIAARAAAKVAVVAVLVAQAQVPDAAALPVTLATDTAAADRTTVIPAAGHTAAAIAVAATVEAPAAAAAVAAGEDAGAVVTDQKT